MTPTCERFEASGKTCVHYAGDGLCKLRNKFRCIEHDRRFAPTLSYSQIQTWTRCKFKWYLTYQVGVEPIELPLPLKRGRIASDVLDLVHAGDANPLAPIKAAYKDRESEDKVERDLAALEGLFSWYLGSCYGELRGRTQFPFEWQELEYPKIRGFLDLVYTDDATMAYEFKYTQNPDNYGSRFVNNDQLCTYFLGVLTLQRITLRAIQVPTLKPLKGESQSQYIERVNLDCARQPKKYVTDTHYWRSEFNLKAHMEKARWIAREIIEACDRGELGCYQNLNACYAPGECEFLKVCESGGAISETLFRYKEKANEQA